MKKLFFLLFLCSSLLAAAQNNVQGTVYDAQHQPIPYATVQLLNADSTLQAGTISDDNGKWILSAPKGRYILQVSYIGYQTNSLGTFVVPRDAATETFLLEETEQIKEVEVKAKKQLIERHMDKLVLNVSNSPLAAGMNGKDILKKAPGVMVDKDGNVTVNGKGVEVYIDGRPSYLSGEQLKAMLEGTDGNTIEKIEIISNPSAKYDASGTGGIINIKTKKNMMKGLNGTLSASYGGMYFGEIKRYLQQEYASLNLNYRTDYSYTNLSLTQVYGDMGVKVESSTQTPSLNADGTPVMAEDGTPVWLKRESDLDYDLNFQYYMLKLGQDFMIDKKNTVGFIFQAPIMCNKQDQKPGGDDLFTGWVKDQDGVLWEQNINTTRNSVYAPQHTANINYTHVFSDSLERELTANIDYNRYATNTVNAQSNISLPYGPGIIYDNDMLSETFPSEAPWLQDSLTIDTKQRVNIYSAKVDFQTQFWKTGMLEAGVKYALSSTDNEMNTDSLTASLKAHNLQDFRYNEHVAAAYVTAGKQFGQVSVKLGLRGEYTYSTGHYHQRYDAGMEQDTTNSRSYFDVFPTAFVGYSSKPLGKAKQSIGASVSYTRRIKRPSYYQMNPFRSYIDAHSYQEGNTELMPEFNNDVQLNFSYSQYLSLSFNFSHTQDMQQTKVQIFENGDGVMRWVNFGTCTTHGGNLSLTELPLVPKFDADHNLQGAWLALTVNAGYYNFINKAYKEIDANYKQVSNYYNMSGNLNAYLPKNWVLSADVWYSAPMTVGYTRQGAMWAASAGVRKMFPKQGLILNLNCYDLFRSSCYNQAFEGLGDGQAATFNQQMFSQKVMLSVTYMFGTQQWHKQRKVGNLEEAERLGGGSTTGGKM